MIRRLSLLWKILLSTSIAITALLALTGWFVQQQTLAVLSQNLQSEIDTGFKAYQAVWQSRTETLRSVSLVLSGMADVRAAFGTRDNATIRDTAGEIWSRISNTSAMFLVCDPHGNVIASLGGGEAIHGELAAVSQALPKFPAQSAGFFVDRHRLYELVITPVYTDGGAGPVLLDVLVAGFPVTDEVSRELKNRTGSDFVFYAGDQLVSSTTTSKVAADLKSGHHTGGTLLRLPAPNDEYLEFSVLASPLMDIGGKPVGELLIARPYDSVRASIAALQTRLIAVWAAVILFAIALSFLLARRILRPIQELDLAASRIARQEYDTHVPEGGDDELGRLARTFNAMCTSIQQARRELIRQERLSTISRLGSSIVHDLRNPLASIYGGAEMLMDGDLNDAQGTRISTNIYRASRNIQNMLQELVDVSRGRVNPAESCRLVEIVNAAVENQTAAADTHGVTVTVQVDDTVELPLERARIERVLQNLIGNAIEAMPNGGRIEIVSEITAKTALLHVRDNGPGIPPEIAAGIFQPFAASSKQGLGLGLALSRQTVLDHGGDLWLERADEGAQFVICLPL